MSGLAFIEERADQRRWFISIGVALLLHAGIAVALLNWPKAIIPVTFTDPFVIDLAPLPSAPGPQQGEHQPLPARTGGPPASEQIVTNAPAAEPIKRAGQIAEKETAANSAGSGEPIAAPTGMTAPMVLAPSNKAAEETSAENLRIGGGGGASHAVPNSDHGASAADARSPATSAMDGPIDTSITVQPSLYGKKAGAGMARKKQLVLLRPSKHSGALEHPRSSSAANGPATMTNAVGARVQDRVRAAHARAVSRAAEAKNAIGSVVATGIVGGGHNANAAAVATNAIGMTVQLRPNLAGTSIGESKTPNAPAGTAANHLVISGRDLLRPARVPGVIGGPAKNVAGVLNGTGFQIRHP